LPNCQNATSPFLTEKSKDEKMEVKAKGTLHQNAKMPLILF